MGIDSTVASIEWPDDKHPSTLNNFEGVARAKRYRVLGTTCRDLGIRALILGHHRDDQAETVLMRLAGLKHRLGLAAMKSSAPLPECLGVFGVDHSGGPVTDKSSVAVHFEHGGIRIVRPMLSLGKSRLISTCRVHGTPWAEDATNHDKTLTERNAFRHLLHNHKLPLALSSDSVLAVCLSIKARIQRHEAAGARIYSACPMTLDIQTGSVVLRFPPVDVFFPGSAPDHVPSPSEKLQARATAQYLLRHILSLVSHESMHASEKIAELITWLWPSLHPDDQPSWTNFSPSRCGCEFTPIKPTPQHQATDPAYAHDRLGPWLISRVYISKRQRMMPSERDYLGFRLQFPASRTSDWYFFDARYWIRVHNHSAHPIHLRMLTDQELEKLMQIKLDRKAPILSPSDPKIRAFDRKQHLRRALASVDSHTLRRGLPALFHDPEHEGDVATPFALPTLQASPSPSLIDPDDPAAPGCTWEIKYKQVDPGPGRSLDDMVRPPVFRPFASDPLTLEQAAVKAQLETLGAFGPVSSKMPVMEKPVSKKPVMREKESRIRSMSSIPPESRSARSRPQKPNPAKQAEDDDTHPRHVQSMNQKQRKDEREQGIHRLHPANPPQVLLSGDKQATPPQEDTHPVPVQLRIHYERVPPRTKAEREQGQIRLRFAKPPQVLLSEDNREMLAMRTSDAAVGEKKSLQWKTEAEGEADTLAKLHLHGGTVRFEYKRRFNR